MRIRRAEAEASGKEYEAPQPPGARGVIAAAEHTLLGLESDLASAEKQRDDNARAVENIQPLIGQPFTG